MLHLDDYKGYHLYVLKEEILGMAGGEVSLPCGSSQFPGLAADDEPILVLWSREGSATPILSADARRGGGLANAKALKWCEV